jgi:aminoglycoside 3-N-acetyltransferase
VFLAEEVSTVPSWLEGLRAGRSRHGLATYVRRHVNRFVSRYIRPIRHRDLTSALRRVGIRPGITVSVHSSLSRFGYVDGGPDTVIDAIQDVVGPEGTVLMPSFPTGVSMYQFVKEDGVFDVRNSPSEVGVITEVFRRRPYVRRSLHPTNPLAAWGRRAEEYLEGHEDSPTPFGHDTPYGRLARDPLGHVLMMETHIHSFLHHLQERVRFPNMFLAERMQATTIDYDGNRRTIDTKIMRPRTPYFVAVPSENGDSPDWAVLHDYALVFPPRRDALIRLHGYTFDGYPVIWQRRPSMLSQGLLHTAELRSGVIGLLSVRGFLETIEFEFRELVERFLDHYDSERIAARDLTYI